MKKSEAFGRINAMSGVVKLKDIITLITSIDNFQYDTLDKLNPVDDYLEGIPISEIYVDLSYQRKLILQQLINRLTKYGGFSKEAAGHIDLARRKDGRLFVWDGFHRAIMGGIAGCTKLPASFYTHNKSLTPSEEQQKEANLFEVRNGLAAKVSAGALFKSRVTGRRPDALKTLDVMKACKLNVEGINPDPDAYDLGGFAFFLKHYDKYEVSSISEASNMIRKIWHEKKNMSVTLLIGLTQFLDANDKPATLTLSRLDILDKLTEIVNSGRSKKNQQHFLRPILNGKSAVSVCYNLCAKGLDELYNDNGQELKTFFDAVGLEEDEIDMLDREQ
jgi:hypothetical protein|tara:strand:+ start:110 stop:1108 length:999 start_codon:yes stop_codon:yes gene_type:complete